MSLVATRFQVRPFRVEDYVEAVRGGWCIGDPAMIGGLWAKNGPAYTGFVNGEVAVCAGIAKLWEGVWEAWAVVTKVGREHPLFVHRHVVHGLRDLIAQQQPRRLQAHTNCAEIASGPWAKRLGFKCEARLKRYGPRGSDFLMWVIFP